MRNYESVVIDLYVDWNATSGVFGKLESGFKWDTLYVPVTQLDMVSKYIGAAGEDAGEHQDSQDNSDQFLHFL